MSDSEEEGVDLDALEAEFVRSRKGKWNVPTGAPSGYLQPRKLPHPASFILSPPPPFPSQGNRWRRIARADHSRVSLLLKPFAICLRGQLAHLHLFVVSQTRRTPAPPSHPIISHPSHPTRPSP